MQENEKRILIAILITVLFITLYDYFFIPKNQYSHNNSNYNQTKSLEPNFKTIADSSNAKTSIIKVNSNDLIVDISKTDGAIKGLYLKNFKQQNQYVSLLEPTSNLGFFYTQFKDPVIDKLSQTSDYNVEIRKNRDSTVIVLTKENDSIKIVKQYEIKDYEISFVTSIYKDSKPLISTFTLLFENNFAKPDKDSHIGAVALVNDKIKTDSDIPNNTKMSWLAFETKYFCFAIYKDVIGGYKIDNNNKFIYINLVTQKPISAYAGPKEDSIISSYYPKLDRIVRFGTFGFIGKPLLYILKYLYSIVGNYGLAIILLTFLIRLIFYPLTYKSFKSMKEMAKLQPQLKELQIKYKGKPELLNKATMELYKKHKVNPLGGCLPILIQIPVFIALYNVLLNAIELRHAPFIFWISDLSSKDPYYITPIIMGITMYIQQKLSPSTLDPMQAKIMLLLPIIFTIMFMGFPSGLVIYWIANNIFTIIQQIIDNKLLNLKANKK